MIVNSNDRYGDDGSSGALGNAMLNGDFDDEDRFEIYANTLSAVPKVCTGRARIRVSIRFASAASATSTSERVRRGHPARRRVKRPHGRLLERGCTESSRCHVHKRQPPSISAHRNRFDVPKRVRFCRAGASTLGARAPGA